MCDVFRTGQSVVEDRSVVGRDWGWETWRATANRNGVFGGRMMRIFWYQIVWMLHSSVNMLLKNTEWWSLKE